MKEQIGQIAGTIWEVLQDKDRIALSQLPKAVGQKESVTYQALGWLAREDKIDYVTSGKITYVQLAHSERFETA